MRKRVLAIALTLSLVLGLMPGTAWAAEADTGENVLAPVEDRQEPGDAAPAADGENPDSTEPPASDGENPDSTEPPASDEENPDGAEPPASEQETPDDMSGPEESDTAPGTEEDADVPESDDAVVSWSFEDGTLTISGTGPMSDYVWHVSDDLEEYTDAPWYSHREEITRIVVEEGVTSIGANAFAGCWNAADVSIADSVESIAEGAFDGCPAMDSPSFTSDAVDAMPLDDGTNTRYAVLVLDISGSMGSRPMSAQKASAIKFCESLLAADGKNYLAIVSFSSGVNLVSDFSDNLEELSAAINRTSSYGSTNTVGALKKAGELLDGIPESAGRSIVLCSDGLPNTGGSEENGPFTSADDYYYYRYANAVYTEAVDLIQKFDLFTLGFFHSLSGRELDFARKFMETIQNAGYYEVTNPDDLEFTFGDIAGDVVTPGHSGIIFVSVPKDKYAIHIVSETGRNLPGVTVTCNGVEGETNNYGIALFDRSLFASNPKITAKRTGYTDWSNEESNWSMTNTGYATIKMYPTSAGKYMLKECTYSNNPDMSKGTDLLTRTKTVGMRNQLWGSNMPGASNINDAMNSGKFYLSCKAVDDSTVRQYELWQGAKQIAVSNDGKFDLQMDEKGQPFVEGGKCFIRVIADGTDESIDTHINLQFKKAELNSEDVSVSFGQESFDIKVGDDIPYFGGGNLNISLPIELPVKVSVGTDSKIRVAFNTKTFEDAGDGLESDWNGKYEQATQKFEDLKKLVDNMKTAKAFGGDYKDFKSLVDKKSRFKLPGADWDAYIAGYAEGDINNSVISGELYIVIEAETKTFGFNTWVWVIPVTVQVKGTAKLNAGGSFKFNYSHTQFEELVAKLKVEIGLDAFAGVGVGKAVGVGVYGDADVVLDASMGTSTGLNSLDLTGDLGVEFYLAWLKYTKSFAHNTWHLYTGNNVRSFSDRYAAESMAAALYNSDNYQVHDLGYLANESEWMGMPAMLFDASAGTQLSALRTNTYNDARPVMVSADDALYAAFLEADRETKDVYVAVTKFDGESWSEPVRVDSDAEMDGAPSLCAGEDGTVWLAYAKTASGHSGTTLIDYAQNQSVVVGSLNPDTLAFTEAASYPGNGYAHLQQLSLVNGNPALVWADSTVTDDNSVLWPAASTLYTASYDGSSWSSAQQAGSVDKPVIQLAAGAQNGSLVAAYVADEDGSYDTVEDQSLYTTAGAAPLVANIQGKLTYGVLPGQAADFIWNAENCLKTAGGAEIPAEGVTNEYAAAGNRLYYSAAGEEGAHLTTVIYDGGSWSAPITLTGGERYLENVSVVNWNDSDYVMGMDTLAQITDNSVIDTKNLVWGKVVPTSNLQLSDINYEADGLTAGAAVPVVLTVTNAGDHTVSGIDVTVNGQTTNQDCSIAPGESADISVDVTCPAELTQYQFTVSESGQDDYDPTDNTGSIGIGYADIVVKAEEERVGTQSSLVVYVTNEGVAPASGSVIITDNSGKQVNITRVPDFNLAAGEMFVISCPMKDGGLYTATAQLADDDGDLYTYNNSDTVSIGDPSEWAADYTITFDANGGSGTLTGAASEGIPYTLPDCPFTPPAGKVFQAWLIDGREYLPGAQYEFTGDTVVTAVWADSWYSSEEEYYISVSQTTGGEIVPTTRNAVPGERVTLYAHPDAGYELDSLTVQDIRGRNISLRDLGGDAYSFIMPNTRVTVDATFVKIEAEPDTPVSTPAEDEPFTGLGTPGISGIVLNPAAMPFTDVKSTDWFYNNVDYVWKHYLMSGVSDTQFAPNTTTNRAMVWTILARMNNVRTDVNPGNTWYDRGLVWARQQGVTDGTNPMGDITREQLATMLWRNAGQPAPGAAADLSRFSDSGTISGYAQTAMRWAVSTGILNGSDGKLAPRDTATRAQIAAMVQRYGEKIGA